MQIVEHETTGLDELFRLRQWAVWKYASEGKQKIPINPLTGERAKSNEPSTWVAYDEALASSDAYDGVGFFLSSDDPYCLIDLDGCISDGEINAAAHRIVDTFDSYTERSPSDTGLHILVRGSKPEKKCKGQFDGQRVEVYDTNQFCTFTGRVIHERDVEVRQTLVDEFYGQVFGNDDEQRDKHGGGRGFPGSDEELLTKARNARNSTTFRKLYDYGNIAGYPSASEADLRLSTLLAFWCGDEPERIERLMRSSKLLRPKWDEHRTYLEDTIKLGIHGCTTFYEPDKYKQDSKHTIQSTVGKLKEWRQSYNWPGVGGKTDRDVYYALLVFAYRFGKLDRDGNISVTASIRQLKEEAHVGSGTTVSKSLARLEDKHSVVRAVSRGSGKGRGKPGEYTIRTDIPGVKSDTPINCVYKAVPLLTPHIRNHSPSAHLETIGKKAAQVLDFIHRSGSASIDEIADHLSSDKKNVKRRYINGLLDAPGFIQQNEDDTYSTPEDIGERITTFLHDSGHDRADILQREKHEREREAYRTRNDRPADTAPSEDEMGIVTSLTFGTEERKLGYEQRVIEDVDTSPHPPCVYPEPEPAMRRNLPEPDASGIVQHGTECACWLCDDDAPEYISVSENIQEAVAA